jgi:hypothetical protein
MLDELVDAQAAICPLDFEQVLFLEVFNGRRDCLATGKAGEF